MALRSSYYIAHEGTILLILPLSSKTASTHREQVRASDYDWRCLSQLHRCPGYLLKFAIKFCRHKNIPSIVIALHFIYISIPSSAGDTTLGASFRIIWMGDMICSVFTTAVS